jgi:hypothetical protein
MEPIWKAAAGVLSTVAPMLATAVGGPLAGAATNAIIGALGLPQDTPPEQVAAAVQNATPEQLLALKRAEQEFAVKMRELDVTLEQLRFSDTANARAREIAVRDWMPRALGLMVVAAAISAVLMVLTGYARVEDALAGSMVQMLVNAALLVLGYYFGSSAGSAAKDAMLRQGGKP